MDVSTPPPPYHSRTAGQVPRSGTHSQTERLPRYTRRNTLAQPLVARREPTEHVFQLMDGRKPSVILKLLSSAKSARCIPTYYEKEKINGTLELEGDSSVRTITVGITGRIVTGARTDDTHTFLNITHPIWSKSPEAPRTPSPSEGASSSKLSGHCVFPISISLPRVVCPGNSGVEYQLPETFTEAETHATVQYELTLHISRGKLRADNRIRTPFGYVPSSRPEPPSLLRQLAYEQNLPIPGPHFDVEGWKTLGTTIARGIVFHGREAEVQCTLSLAKPLCYTRGSVIPCFLNLWSIDRQTLDWVSNPNSIALTLCRKIKYYNAPAMAKSEVSWKETSKDICTARWWPSGTIQGDSQNRYLEGEIRLPKDLRPSSEVAHFSISYSVDLYPFDLAGFKSHRSREPMLSEPIEIVTMYAKGPRPVAWSPPPAYDPTPRNDDIYAALR
ncbi:hypothetical protein Moror_3906 [Moniliophthora roreri MCA 2997]|uniref:Arrestin-like N-terminal domain-containing protein n=1 Tax=Moniliophthora roreri (strain MCA 2997) TaxID=1381753 RepID=V2YUI6_MONRO|nr:hypothetical protein Moror_3906 [Moniliophthora roreri MCA 2997]